MHIIHKQLYQCDKCVDFNRTSGMVIYYKNNVYCGFARRKTLIVLTYVTITASKQLAVLKKKKGLLFTVHGVYESTVTNTTNAFSAPCKESCFYL